MNPRRLALSAATWFMVAAMSPVASGETIFFDDFSDADAADGAPASWVPIGNTTIDASSGDMLVTGSIDAPSVNPDWRFAGATVLGEHGDISLRVQSRLPANQAVSWISISVRANGASIPFLDSYGMAINDSGLLFYGRLGEPPLDGRMTAVPTSFRPRFEDVVMQVDAVDDTIRFWAWRPGEQMPDSPIGTVFDQVFESGAIAVWVGGRGSDRIVTGGFRYVQVADSPIPEPSALLIAVFAACGYALRRSSRRPRAMKWNPIIGARTSDS